MMADQQLCGTNNMMQTKNIGLMMLQKSLLFKKNIHATYTLPFDTNRTKKLL